MNVYVGLDCGGSTSRVLAVDERGVSLFQGHSGAANLISTPEHKLRRSLQTATKGCPAPDFVCGCFAGLINDEIRAKGVSLLREVFPAAEVRAEPDYTAAFYASPDDTDLCIIAGTGSLVCSRSNGQVVKSGGRGFILGDYGSGYCFGRDALIYFLDNPKSSSKTLRNAVLQVLGTTDEGPIIAAIYQSATPATILSKLAKALGMDAAAGESYAVSSIERNFGELVDVVKGHVDKYMASTEKISISLAGGLWKGAPVYRDKFSEMVVNTLSDRHVTTSKLSKPPLHGAVELAKEMHIGN